MGVREEEGSLGKKGNWREAGIDREGIPEVGLGAGGFEEIEEEMGIKGGMESSSLLDAAAPGAWVREAGEGWMDRSEGIPSLSESEEGLCWICVEEGGAVEVWDMGARGGSSSSKSSEEWWLLVDGIEEGIAAEDVGMIGIKSGMFISGEETGLGSADWGLIWVDTDGWAGVWCWRVSIVTSSGMTASSSSSEVDVGGCWAGTEEGAAGAEPSMLGVSSSSDESLRTVKECWVGADAGAWGCVGGAIVELLDEMEIRDGRSSLSEEGEDADDWEGAAGTRGKGRGVLFGALEVDEGLVEASGGRSSESLELKEELESEEVGESGVEATSKGLGAALSVGWGKDAVKGGGIAWVKRVLVVLETEGIDSSVGCEELPDCFWLLGPSDSEPESGSGSSLRKACLCISRCSRPGRSSNGKLMRSSGWDPKRTEGWSAHRTFVSPVRLEPIGKEDREWTHMRIP
jgi:hypothetical protein